jgi:polysaccharide biosynthesis transport protein
MTHAIENMQSQNIVKDPWELSKLGFAIRRHLLLFLLIFGSVTFSVAYKTWSQKPVYRQQFQLFLDISTGEQFNPLSENYKPPSYLPLQLRDFKTDMEILASYKVISPLLPDIQRRYPNLRYGNLTKNLKLKNRENTAIIEVSYEDSDPEKIKFVLEKLSQAYTDYSLEKLQTSTNQAIRLVDSRLPQLKNRVDYLQRDLQTLRRKYNLVDPEQQSKLLSDGIGNIVKQKLEAKAMLGESQSNYNDLRQKLGLDTQQAMAISALNEAPRYLGLNSELQKLDGQIASESANVTDINPTILALQEKREYLSTLIEQEAVEVLNAQGLVGVNIKQLPALSPPNKIQLELIQKLVESGSQIQGMQSRLRSIGGAESQARQQMQQFAGVSREYTDLNRNLEVANQSLNRFMASRENLQIETVRKVSPWQVISKIDAPTQPISPNPPRDLLVGGIAGLLAGVGAAIIAEKLNNKYHSPEELQDETKQTLLGTIPFYKKLETSSEIVSRNLLVANSSHWEACISLQANLDFIQPDRSLKSLVVSSALPGDGKSITSWYLAKVAAAMGKRVLLVDADMRRPTIHRYLDSVTNVWGLSNAIAGATPTEKLIQSVSEQENLYILTAGQSPPNPVELLASEKMKNLLEQFLNEFDLVIFDTPPLHGFADAKFLAAQTDGLLMVVGLDKTEKPAVRQVLNDLRVSSVNLLGLVANGLKGYVSSYSSYYENYYGNSKETQEIDRFPLLTGMKNLGSRDREN